MADSLTTLISKLQALFMDDGTLFSTATCTAAIRHALLHLNLSVPVQGGTLIDSVADQHEYELTDALAGATPLSITDVLLADPSGGEYDLPVVFRDFSEDERWFIRLEQPIAAGNQMIVRFTQAHTVNGLDGAAESTLPASSDVVLLNGAAARACEIAAVGKIESNNLDPHVSGNYLDAAAHFERAFMLGLKALLSRRRLQSSVPDLRAWNDEWHGWPSPI